MPDGQSSSAEEYNISSEDQYVGVDQRFRFDGEQNAGAREHDVCAAKWIARARQHLLDAAQRRIFDDNCDAYDGQQYIRDHQQDGFADEYFASDEYLRLPAGHHLHRD